MLEHDEIKKTRINKLYKLIFLILLIICIFFSINYLKKPDHDGSLTCPTLVGSLNLAPLRVSPASKPVPSSDIA
jgi:hypothetical protein